jgi:hypothetical protein
VAPKGDGILPMVSWTHVRAAMTAALATNLLDAATTWIAITIYHGREAGVIAWAAVRAWGLIPALFVMKGSGVVFILAIAAAGTEGVPRWWRVLPCQRWTVVSALWIAAAWFGYLALRNAVAAWILYRLASG